MTSFRRATVTDSKKHDELLYQFKEIQKLIAQRSNVRRITKSSPREDLILPAQTWFGQTTGTGFPQGYIDIRGDFASAAYRANWDKLFTLMEQAKKQYGENLVNCYALSKYRLNNHRDASADVT